MSAELNVQIAELCGWSPCPLFSNPSWTQDPSGLIGPFVFDLPDYCGDLNAMHEAEKTLTAEERERYMNELWNPDGSNVFATAEQRARAFLAAKGGAK